MGLGHELIAAILGHHSASTRETQTLVRHYLRTDKLEQKRTALKAWDQRVREIVSGNSRSEQNILPLNRPA
jgi:hypothetical protein